jgi:dimethylglycine dehydrogenase
MSEFPKTARVVIIGGGVVGASALFHLAKAGWTDCILIEKNELTAGSTWHAAGNVPTFSTSWSIMNMQRYSTELYSGLAQEVDYPMNYHMTGSIRLAHSKERMQEFERAKGMGQYQGMDINILGLDEIKNIYPFIETHDLSGALYDPSDGDIDPAQLTQALAKGARDLGAEIIRFCSASGVSRKNKEWIIHTTKGDIRCEYVVNAAGYYAQRVGEWFIPYGGRTVPMMVMSHQYLLFEEVDAVKDWSSKEQPKLPLLRDVDSSYYLRQEKFGFNLGPYERNCRAHWAKPEDPMPEDFSFQLYPDDLDRLEWYIEDALARVPLLGEAGVSKVINGPIPYAPDGLPLIGPMPGVPNAFEACVFTFGIAQGGGAGKVLSEWIIEGETEWDMWSCDPRRYTDYTDHDYCVAKGMEIYGHEYAMHFPWHEWPAGRNKKLSPAHDQITKKGGQMGAYNGWERANWFAHTTDDITEKATQTWTRSGPWEQRIKEECYAVRDEVGVLDLPGFSRFDIEGKGTAAWLKERIAGSLPKIGRLNLAYFADKRGRTLSEMSVIRHSEEKFTLITAASAQWHDWDIVNKASSKNISVTDNTNSISTLIVTGPKSRDLLEKIGTNADLYLPWLSHQKAKVCGQPCHLMRVSFAGELGWELHTKVENISKLYKEITEAGAKPFGMWALNSLRIEKGYRAWKGDLSTDYSLQEAGLSRFIQFDKEENFLGKAALEIERQQGIKKQFVTLIVSAGECDAPYMSTLWKNGQIVGETTSGAWGYRTNSSIALGMIRSDLASAGTEIEVEIFGDRHNAVVQANGSIWDPLNERLRA